MKSRSFRGIAVIAGFLTLALAGSARAQTLIGPAPYLSFNDSPFKSTSDAAGFQYFHLETFEDGLFNTPGVSVSAQGEGVINGTSVDGDDGTIDGSGAGGRAYRCRSGPAGAGGLTFTFNATVLGTLPTHVGIVWTIGDDPIVVEARRGPTLLGTLTGNHRISGSSTTADDRFYGIVDPGGISSIQIRSGPSGGGGFHVDHLQYGFGAVAVPPAQGFTFLVSSAGNNRVLQFDQTGTYVGDYIAPGTGGLAVPLDLTFGPSGSLYLSNRDGDRILRELGASVILFTLSGGLNNPHGLAFGQDGDLYVSAELTSTGLAGTSVLKYDGATGAFLGAFATGLNLPAGIVFGPDGNLYVADTNNDAVNGGSVRRYDGTTGALIDIFAAGIDAPRGISFGLDGDLYVTETRKHDVLRFDGATGASKGVFASGGGLSGPYSARFGPDGNLYVTSSGTSQVLRYDAMTGAFLGVAAQGNGLSSPTYLTFVAAAPDCAGVQAQLDTANATITGLQGQLAAANGTIATLQGQLDAANGTIASLQGQLDAAEAMIAALEGQLDAANSSIMDLQGQVAARDATIAGLQGQVAARDATIAGLQGQVAACDGTIADLQGQLAAANATIADLQAQLANPDARVAALEQTVDSLVDRLFGLMPDALVAAAARDAAQEEIASAIAAVGANDRRVQRAQRSFGDGLAALAAGNHAKAVREFREAFKIAHRV